MVSRKKRYARDRACFTERIVTELGLADAALQAAARDGDCLVSPSEIRLVSLRLARVVGQVQGGALSRELVHEFNRVRFDVACITHLYDSVIGYGRNNNLLFDIEQYWGSADAPHAHTKQPVEGQEKPGGRWRFQVLKSWLKGFRAFRRTTDAEFAQNCTHSLRLLRWFVSNSAREDVDQVASSLEADILEMLRAGLKRVFIRLVVTWRSLRCFAEIAGPDFVRLIKACLLVKKLFSRAPRGP